MGALPPLKPPATANFFKVHAVMRGNIKNINNVPTMGKK